MATENLTWGACGSAATGQSLYYGKLLIATGNPIAGTGWTLFTGSQLANSVSSASITGLDDNVEYMFYLYCNCSTGTNGPLINIGPAIKYVCPTVTASANFNTVTYSLTVPTSANNAGSWIQTIRVTLLDSAGVTTIATNVHNSPFAGTISSNFTGLNPSTTYTLKVAYSNSGFTRTNQCTSQTLTTAASCVAPTVSITNITSTAFDVNFSPTGGGDTFNILINSSAVATGLTTSPFTVSGLTAATTYQVNVVRNCSTGGSATSATQNASTGAIPNTVFITNSLPNCAITNVTGITGFTFVGPVNPGGSSNGTHSAFTNSVITVTVSGSATGVSGVELDKDHVLFQEIAVPAGPSAAGTYTFNPLTVLVGDNIEIFLNTP